MRHNVQTTVNSVLRGLQIAQSNLERQARKFEGRISSAPQQEKEFLTISRQQEIKATLYIMLLQKREENAITLASTANNGRIIKAALPSKKPVSPKKKIVLLAAFVLETDTPVNPKPSDVKLMNKSKIANYGKPGTKYEQLAMDRFARHE